MLTKKGKQRLFWKKQWLFSLIVVFLLFGMGEVVLRTWAFFFRTSYESYNFAAGRLELVPNIKYTTPSGDEFMINSRGFLGPEFDERPMAGVYRIIAIGDSCTFSGGIWSKAYPGILGNLLNNNGARRKYEVINGGIEGYNSTFALDRIRQEIVGYEPRLVVIYIGWNDLMKTNPDNLSKTGRYTVLSQLLERSYLVKAYAKVMFQYLRPLVFRPNVIASEDDARAFEKFVPRAYEENLSSAIEILRQHGTKVILVTVPTVVNSRMTREEIRKQHVFFPYFAGTYSVAKFLSLHKAYNNVIHAVGKKLAVPVVDLDQIFNDYGDQKSRLFWDTMHPSGEGHILIAKSLSPIIQKELN